MFLKVLFLIDMKSTGYRYFLRGINDYVYIPHKKVDNSPAGIEEYCQSHIIRKVE